MDLLNDVVEIKGSAVKMAGLVLLGVLMTALSAAIALGFIPAPDGSLAQFAGWIGAVFFGAMTAIGVSRLFSAGKTVLTLSPSGYLDTRLSERPIAWTAIRDVLVWTMQGQKVIVLAVPPETEAAVGLTRIARWSRGANARLGADGLCTMASGLKISHADLLAAILARVEAAQGGR